MDAGLEDVGLRYVLVSAFRGRGLHDPEIANGAHHHMNYVYFVNCHVRARNPSRRIESNGAYMGG